MLRVWVSGWWFGADFGAIVAGMVHARTLFWGSVAAGFALCRRRIYMHPRQHDKEREFMSRVFDVGFFATGCLGSKASQCEYVPR